jgi:hypothetical protein
VNTCDPADGNSHVHMARQMDPYSVPLEYGRTGARLPTGYANRSPRTCLRHRRSPRRGVPPTPDLLPPDATADVAQW